jgi:hypothetical protein
VGNDIIVSRALQAHYDAFSTGWDAEDEVKARIVEAAYKFAEKWSKKNLSGKVFPVPKSSKLSASACYEATR